ncbi:hypothetical protein HanIR_Chr13g0650381 [Helianthus annuus]|nr:hypothetical protein HanIR_Chr13g0650381 [Helianthus annuus]
MVMALPVRRECFMEEGNRLRSFAGSDWELYPCQGRFKGAWFHIVKLGRFLKVAEVDFNSLVRAEIGKGDTIRFWLDPWISDKPLKVWFPNLYRLETEKHCKVSDRVLKVGGASSFAWRWKNDPTSLDVTMELTDCFWLLANVKLSSKKDSWSWHGTGSEFIVVNIKKWISSTEVTNTSAIFYWCQWLPKNYNIFMWRARLECLPTKEALLKRNVQVGNNNTYSQVVCFQIFYGKQSLIGVDFQISMCVI